MEVSNKQAYNKEYKVFQFNDVGSTNLEAFKLLRKGVYPPFWVLGESQNSGKGRAGRKWVSAKGNFYSSYVMHSQAERKYLAQLSFVAAVSVFDSLRVILAEYKCNYELKIKWPNDILLKGKKICGILLESEACMNDDSSINNEQVSVQLDNIKPKLDNNNSGYGLNSDNITSNIVIGIGINFLHKPKVFEDISICLSEVGVEVSIDRFSGVLNNNLTRWVEKWHNGLAFESVREYMLENIFGLGQKILVNVNSGIIRGELIGINYEGAIIILDNEGKERVITAGDVQIL